jgi:hypothetical protein
MTLAEKLSSLQWGGDPYPKYEGRLDRAAQQEAKSAFRDAQGTAAEERSAADAERAQLTPFYRQEMNAQHGFNPTQTNELLDFAGATTGGEGATTEGAAASEAARTRNTSGFSSGLDEAARQRQQQMSKVGQAVGAEDVMGAKQLNQEGAAGMSGLYGTDTKGMLDAMGQQHEDINSQIDASKTGWYQNLLAGINTVTGGKGFSMPK